VQSLIDARGQVERWADHPVEVCSPSLFSLFFPPGADAFVPQQFHFANITSAWIRRALIAGGFGYAGTGSHDIPTEVTSIVPYRGVLSGSGSPPPDVESVPHKEGDGGRGGTEENGAVPLLDRATPYFHIDLVAAVRAAERVSVHSRGSVEK
jgi:solute carrier family 26 (sodium-independent sulfate anion transporter), member 11